MKIPLQLQTAQEPWVIMIPGSFLFPSPSKEKKMRNLNLVRKLILEARSLQDEDPRKGEIEFHIMRAMMWQFLHVSVFHDPTVEHTEGEEAEIGVLGHSTVSQSWVHKFEVAQINTIITGG